MKNKFLKLEKSIINCIKCPRLVKFRNKIASNKRKQFINENYWGRPVSGFGDHNAKILIVGLAPAAHGGNRTGRAFTGDKSGDFLFSCLHKAKIANQHFSVSLDDGLKLNSAYITNILKCVPPEDKPLDNELNNCLSYFENEISNIKKLKIIITLGKVAFDNCIKFYKKKYNFNKNIHFKHGKFYKLPDNITLLPCYHPSPRNVNTKIVSKTKMINIFKKALKIINEYN